MKTTRIVLILLTFYSITIGQNQLDSLVALEKGIDTTKQYLIYDYRLPEWGYERFYFDFSGSITGNDRTAKANSMENNQHNIQLRPYYYRYTESENLISSIQSSLRTYYRYGKDEDLEDNDSWEYNDTRRSSRIVSKY